MSVPKLLLDNLFLSVPSAVRLGGVLDSLFIYFQCTLKFLGLIFGTLLCKLLKYEYK